MDTKEILDPCCGSRMFYFDKKDPRVHFCDLRTVSDTLCDGRPLVVSPDEEVDFRSLPFPCGAYPLVIFDPPHLRKAGENGWQAKKYGKLPLNGWKEYLGQGMKECWRVLAPGGTMVFKWNEEQIRISQIVDIFPDKPVMGTRTKPMTLFIVFHKPRAAVTADFMSVLDEKIRKTTRDGCWRDVDVDAFMDALRGRDTTSEVEFASNYSHRVWEKLMATHSKSSEVGFNDISDIVLNAILDAFKWKRENNPKSDERIQNK